jgi:outer membrane lipoprotein carrier protein
MIMHWLTASLLAASLAVTGQENALERLDAFAEGLDTLSGRFEQTTLDADGAVTEEASGEFYFTRPDRFRWDYDEPFPQQIVADGEKMWHYDESLEQVSVRDQPAADESPLLVIMRPELLQRFYRVSDSDGDSFEFVPRSDNAEIEQGRIEFEDGAPVLLELLDRFGQVTRLRLLDLERNPELSADRFEFEVPPGVDVLEGY